MFRSKVWKAIDVRLVMPVIGLMIISVINLYSATFGLNDPTLHFYQRQLVWFAMGTFAALVVCWIDYRYYEYYAYLFYAAASLLVIAVLAHGIAQGGVRRWIHLGYWAFQPSEFAKIALILALARYFTRYQRTEYRLRDLCVPVLIVLLPTILIAKQPDLGTALIMLFIFFSIVLFVRIRLRSLMILLLISVLTAPALWWVLKDYQRDRILTFLNPEMDPLGAGYHVIQSKIALGSGGIWGKGFLEGTQCKLQFLPEHHTDFVFAVLGEEWGFVGCMVVLLLLLAVVVVGLTISARAKDRFGAIVAFGVTALIFWHTVVNVGMVVGIMPVVGLPLPFLSYGGSSALTNAVGLGLLLNVSARRHIF
jgi:rod shape determining protein RodA